MEKGGVQLGRAENNLDEVLDQQDQSLGTENAARPGLPGRYQYLEAVPTSQLCLPTSQLCPKYPVEALYQHQRAFHRASAFPFVLACVLFCALGRQVQTWSCLAVYEYLGTGGVGRYDDAH